ncbi:YczE/YyaS/YitT family protein [Ornithinibacillus halotolerans]|uniref:Membrane protein n=1 Tax=Ornithinibacillus halotolerans TaxID=1274357 RepID=A0A916S3U1_9BACI|nr:hypothetical protein [Ornithinibacillus halotolerans]GGA79913.1 membrane protein [Ornithinibacillus halotolerans]
MKQLKRIILLIFLVIMVGFSVALVLKAAIGVGSWDALAQSVTHITGTKVGTIGIIFNIALVFGQWVLLRKDFTFYHLLQVPVIILLGTVVNFSLYQILSPITIDSYVLNFLLIIIAFILLASFNGALMELNMVTMPLEGFCMAVSIRTNYRFPIVRQVADIVIILSVLVLTFAFTIPSTIREGTIIGMVIYAPILGFAMKLIRPLFTKLGSVSKVNKEIEHVDVKLV